MGIDHDVVLGSLGYCIKIMVHQPLAVVILSARENVSYIAGFHGIVAIVVHEFVGLFHVPLVIPDGRRSLVMHDQLDPLRMGIFIQCLNVKVRIRCDKVKYLVLGAIGPILPADVPALDKHGVKAVFRREVNVASYILVVGTVTAVRLGVAVICDAQLDGRIIICI